MTLEQLRIFVAVAERGNMTRAAEALGVTQSAASAAIAALEARHGVRLFDRVGRGLALSEAGAVFLDDARAVLARAQVATEALSDLAGMRRGRVRIAASQTVANYWLPRAMAAFASRFAAITVELTAANTAQVAQAVAEGLADLGFAEGTVTDTRLSQTVVGRDRLSLYAAPDHPLVRAAQVTTEDLEQVHWVMRETGSGTRSALEAALRLRGLDPAGLRVLLQLPSNEAVLGAVARGGLLAAVSDLAAAPHVAAGYVRAAPYDLPPRPFNLLRHRDRQPSHAAQAFIAAL